MNELISGLSLMLVGMSTVFCFLTLLVICINIASKIINRFWPEEITSTQHSTTANDDVIAAITAAVHQYRNKHSRKKHK